MRIGIDGRPLVGPRAGIGRYLFELCRELDRCLPQATFLVYSQVPVEMPVVSERWVSRVDGWKLASLLKGVVWLKCRCGSLCASDALDVFWAPAVFLPRLSPLIRTVSSVHDLNHRIVPRTMGIAHLWAHRLFFVRDVRSADRVVVNSEGTAMRLAQFTGRRASAIVRPGVGAAFRLHSEEEIARCLADCGVRRPYFLAVGTWEPRKNLDLLIDVFLRLKSDGFLANHRLVLAGGEGWKEGAMREHVVAGRVADVHSLGYVSDERLAKLYAGSEAFLFPSLYEGFGSPVIEALASGARVVASDLPEIREAGGDGVTYIRPTAEGIREGILAAAREAKGRVAIEGVQFRSYRASAELLAQVLCELKTLRVDRATGAEVGHSS